MVAMTSVGLMLAGCADPIEDCVARKQADYRQLNPNANYAVASTANERFRRECELYQSQPADEEREPQHNVRSPRSGT